MLQKTELHLALALASKLSRLKMIFNKTWLSAWYYNYLAH